MVNVGPLKADIGSGVWGTPANFNGFRVWHRYCTSVAQWRSAKCTMFGHLLGWYVIYISWGSFPLTEVCQLQNSLCVQVLRPPTCILAPLLHETRAVGVSQSLRRGTRNEITELSQRAPPIFGRAAITLGIGPHSGT